MSIEGKKIVRRVLQHYASTGAAGDELVKVTLLPNDKSTYVEQIGADGRTILLDEYKVDDKVFWAQYSERTKTVYISPRGVPPGAVA